MPTGIQHTDLQWDVSQPRCTAGVRSLHHGSTEQIMALEKHDINWTGEQWKLFYDKTDLINGNDENPGSLYAIDVNVLDTLLGLTNYYSEVHNDPDNAADDSESDMRVSYARAVVTITDGGYLVVIC